MQNGHFNKTELYLHDLASGKQNIHVSEKEVKHAWGKCNLLNLLFTVHKECRGSVSSMELMLPYKTCQHKLRGRQMTTQTDDGQSATDRLMGDRKEKVKLNLASRGGTKNLSGLQKEL